MQPVCLFNILNDILTAHSPSLSLCPTRERERDRERERERERETDRERDGERQRETKDIDMLNSDTGI